MEPFTGCNKPVAKEHNKEKGDHRHKTSTHGPVFKASKSIASLQLMSAAGDSPPFKALALNNFALSPKLTEAFLAHKARNPPTPNRSVPDPRLALVTEAAGLALRWWKAARKK